eukprot:2315124-Rhodomonas_salina.1
MPTCLPTSSTCPASILGRPRLSFVSVLGLGFRVDGKAPRLLCPGRKREEVHDGASVSHRWPVPVVPSLLAIVRT